MSSESPNSFDGMENGNKREQENERKIHQWVKRQIVKQLAVKHLENCLNLSGY